MSLNPSLAINSRNVMMNQLAPLLNSGFIEIYDGTQPANADTAVSTQNLICTLTFGSTAFGASSGGTITANAITSGTAVFSSTATWCRLYKSDGTTVVMDGSVGTSAANLVVVTTSIASGVVVSCSSFTISLGY